MSFSFKEFLADIGEAMDDGVGHYKAASTHTVTVKSGGRTILSVKAPIEPVKKAFDSVAKTVSGAADSVAAVAVQAHKEVVGFVHQVGDLSLEVRPIPAQKGKPKRKTRAN